MDNSEKIIKAFLLGFQNKVTAAKLTREQFKRVWTVRYPSFVELYKKNDSQFFYVCTVPLSDDEIYAVILDENKEYLTHRLASDTHKNK